MNMLYFLLFLSSHKSLYTKNISLVKSLVSKYRFLINSFFLISIFCFVKQLCNFEKILNLIYYLKRLKKLVL